MTRRGAAWQRACIADADEAFAVVHHECAATTYSVAHEIGHIIGARHDLNLDKMMTPFSFGHGYVNGTKWRDIMSYKESCGGCPRLPVWSSPKVMVKGEPAGTPELDNARVIPSRPPASPRSGRREVRPDRLGDAALVRTPYNRGTAPAQRLHGWS